MKWSRLGGRRLSQLPAEPITGQGCGGTSSGAEVLEVSFVPEYLHAEFLLGQGAFFEVRAKCTQHHFLLKMK